MKFIVQDREAGNVIEKFNTIEEAKKAVIQFEEEDKIEGSYEDNFYEIVEFKEVITEKVEKSEVTEYIIHLLPSQSKFIDLSYCCVDLSGDYYTEILELLSKLPSKVWLKDRDDMTLITDEIEVYHKDHFIRLFF